MTINETTQTAYTPLIWDATLPRAEGVTAVHYQTNVPTNDQIQQSAALFSLLQAQDHTAFDALHSITTPAPMLIQNPGKNTVRFIMGTAKFLADPLHHPSGHELQGRFLAIGEDLLEPTDTPRPLILPDDALKTNMVKVPTETQFAAKMAQKATELDAAEGQFDTTQWFKHSDAGTILHPLAKVCPMPPFLAYDAFVDNITAHIIWERICYHEDAHPSQAAMFKGIKSFLQEGVHTKHLTSQASTAVPRDTFERRPHRDAVAWAKTRLRHILPLNSPSTPPRQIHVGPSGGTVLTDAATEFHSLIRELRREVTPPSTPPEAQGATAENNDPHTQQKKKYGVAGEDFLHLLKLCGLTDGQEELLPAHYGRMAETHLSTDGKDRIAKETLETLRYPEHHVPAHPLILRLIKNKQFSGDDDSYSKEAVMKGLTPYLVVDITEDEVQVATAHEDAVALATTTTTSDIKALFNKKATIPKSFTNLISTLKRFANLLQCLFGGQCPLLTLVCTLIRHMTGHNSNMLKGMDSRSIAATMWVVYKETRMFTAGKLARGEQASINWIHMQTAILTAQSLHRNDVPVGIDGASGGGPTKQQGETKRKETASDGGTSKQGATKVQKLRDIETVYKVHPRVAAEITPRIPLGYKLKATMERLKVNKNVFGIQTLCWHAAIRGKCVYNNCPKDHELTKTVDDAAVDLALSNLAPVFKHIEAKGKTQS